MRFSLALAQLRHLGWRWLVAALGIAVVATLPVVAAIEADQVRREVVAQAVDALSPADRLVAVTGEAKDPRPLLSELTPTPAIRQLEFRQLSNRGEAFQPAAVDDLRDRADLTGGHWPAPCTATRCEVLLAGRGLGAAALEPLRSAVAELGLAVVGTAELTDPRVATGPFDPATTPLLLGTDVDGLRSLPALAALTSHLDWITTLDPDRVAELGVPDFLDRVRSVSAELAAADPAGQLLITTTSLSAADARAGRATSTFPLVDGLAAALIIGFALVGAAGLVLHLQTLGGVLRRRGATERTSRSVLLLTLALVVLGGAVAGLLVAVLVALLRGTPAAPLGPAVAIGVGLGLLALVAAAAVVVVDPGRAGGLRRGVETAIVLALPAVALAAARGNDSGGDPLVWVLPAAVCLLAGLIAARGWALTRPLARRRLPLPLRLCLAHGGALRPAATAGLLAAAVTTMVFAGGYGATLAAAAQDQAAWQVPTGVRLDPAGSTPLTTTVPAPISGLEGVLRSAGSVESSPGVHDTVSVLGVPSDLVAGIDRWSRTTGSDRSAPEVAAALRGSGTPRTYPLTEGALTLPVTGWDAALLGRLFLRGTDGRAGTVALRPSRTTGNELTGPLPSGGPWRVTAFVVTEQPDHLQQRLHASGEGTTDVAPPAGDLTFGENTLGLPVRTTPYRLDGAPLVITPGPAPVVPVAVDPATAALARNGTLQITVGAPLEVRVVAVMPRLPSAGPAFVLADRDTLADALDAVQPGQQVAELWGRTTPPELATAPTLRTQHEVAQALRQDPAARGGRTLLTVLGYGGLALAGLAVIVLVLAERRDGAQALLTWESEGATPATLRRMLALRPVLVGVIALPVGLVAGLLLVRGVAGVIAVEAWGRAMEPPLIATSGAGAAIAVAGTLVAVAIACTCTAFLLREPTPAGVTRR